MAFDVSELADEEFQELCKQLLESELYRLTESDVPFDLRGTDPTGKTVAIECKRARNDIGTLLRWAAIQLEQYRALSNVDRVILIVSVIVPASKAAVLGPTITLLDRASLDALLTAHPHIATRFATLARVRAEALGVPREAEAIASDHATRLKERLAQLPRGHEHYRAFEDLGVEILNYVFHEILGPPRIQTRSDDGLDRRDAIYPIVSPGDCLTLIRSACQTMFVVAEFKNLTNSPGQSEVESLQQYLYADAMRRFGLLVARSPPSSAAEASIVAGVQETDPYGRRRNVDRSYRLCFCVRVARTNSRVAATRVLCNLDAVKAGRN